ncbi:dUTP diphosphatase [bacterium]|nr:dUTP diphosphatase [bacterium]
MQQVPVKIKLFDHSFPMPAYQTAGAAAFDLYARIDATLAPDQILPMPTNIAVQIPEDYWLLVAARSSLYKRSLNLVNDIGIIDTDYCGDNDEITIILHNFGQQTVHIKAGERLAQGILVPRLQAQFTQVEHLESANRGGFGSTGL